jgi:methyltransferase (TIGR00027 family)
LKEGKASQTALGVAAWMLLGAGKSDHEGVLPDGAAELTRSLLDTVPRAKRLAAQFTGSGFLEAWAKLNERVWTPGMALHIRTRKRYVDDAARQALADGAGQVVVLGAGFDTLAPRLARKFPDVRFFEVDHPPTQDLKQRALSFNGIVEPNLHFLPADFRKTTLETILGRHPEYSTAKKSFFVAEGLTMYLAGATVDQLFRSVQRIAPGGSRLAFTFVEMKEDGTLIIMRFPRLVLLRLRLAGEPFLWGLMHRDLGSFLSERGFRLLDAPGVHEIRERYLTHLDDQTLPGWEHLALAELKQDAAGTEQGSC